MSWSTIHVCKLPRKWLYWTGHVWTCECGQQFIKVEHLDAGEDESAFYGGDISPALTRTTWERI